MKPKKSVSILLIVILGITLSILGAQPASANAECSTVYAVFARGTGAKFGAEETSVFRSEVTNRLSGITVQSAELGDLDSKDFTPKTEYPASAPPFYSNSVEIGKRELVNHLNDRAQRCPTETVILGGYSQGADVIGKALESGLTQAAKNRIGYAALYGDPKFNPGSLEMRQQWQRPWWVQGDDPGFRYRRSVAGNEVVLSNTGMLGARVPYISSDFLNRFGSWCAYSDGMCNGSMADNGSYGTHGEIYQNYWIASSVSIIAAAVRQRIASPAAPAGVAVPMSLPSEARPGSIIQSDQGHLYVYAGGRLFWFDKHDSAKLNAFKTQARQLTGSDSYIPLHSSAVHAIEVNRDSSGNHVPGSHMPMDNAFLYEYGNAAQYVIKFQRPFAIGSPDEVVALGGQDKAVMVPSGLADLQLAVPQWVENDLLRFGTDPSVWHVTGNRGYRVSGVPTRDCLSIRHSRGVTLMPASAWNSFPTHPTQQAACDFTHGQVLVGQPSGRQAIVLYGAGDSIGSPEEAVAIGAANRAQVVTDETVNGLLARTPTVPQGHVFRAGLQTRAYHFVDGKLHPIGSPATRDCLLARGGLGTGEEVVPASFISRYPVSSIGAYCELENRLLLAPNGVTVGYVKDGYRRPVTNPAVRDCIAMRAGAGQPVAVSDQVWNSYTAGPDAYCPYELIPGANFVREDGDSTVWLVGPGAGAPGTKRHAGSLCVPDPYTTQLKQYRVSVVPRSETAGHIQGADWWADGPKCQGLPQG